MAVYEYCVKCKGKGRLADHGDERLGSICEKCQGAGEHIKSAEVKP